MSGSGRMSRLVTILAAAVLVLAATLFRIAPALAQSESVELDTSTREISIEPDFNGADIVIFGSVDNSKQEAGGSAYYDIVVVIRGPAETVVSRRKERVAGIWLNGASRSFDKVPSFYGVLSTRPISDITDPDTLRRFDIEFDPTPLQEEKTPPDDFEKALLRIKEREGLYVKEPRGVVFLSRSLFRATIRMPAQVQEGTYTAQIYLFHAGKLLSWDKSLLEVRKAGIERYLHTLALHRPWIYGMLAVLLAVTCGFLGWTLFSRG